MASQKCSTQVIDRCNSRICCSKQLKHEKRIQFDSMPAYTVYTYSVIAGRNRYNEQACIIRTETQIGLYMLNCMAGVALNSIVPEKTQ